MMGAMAWRRRAGLASAAAAAGLIVLALAFRCAGRWLVTADALEPARAVVVLGGQVPFRAMEAANIYRQGWTHEVWLTRGRVSEEDEALVQLGIDRPSEAAYSRQVLERLGVPKGSVRELAESTPNTADEVRAVARELEAAGGNRVILVTSKYHTRRAKALWRTLVGGPPNAPEMIVRYTPEDPFDAGHWWHTTTDAMAVSREWFGLLNVWAGLPLKSTR
jgi:uncharacterized SAM-binding protein YcdF (DUF218 family)